MQRQMGLRKKEQIPSIVLENFQEIRKNNKTEKSLIFLLDNFFFTSTFKNKKCRP